MRLFVLLFVINSFGQTMAQKLDSIAADWDEMVIQDYQGGKRFSKKYTFQLQRSNYLLTKYQKPDSVVKKIDSMLIKRLLSNLDYHHPKDPYLLDFFGKDSTWFHKQILDLWKTHFHKYYNDQGIDSMVIKQEVNTIRNIVWKMQGAPMFHDLPLINVVFKKKTDTLLFMQAFGQFPFMHPWWVNGSFRMNYKIPYHIAQLFPDSLNINKDRIAGTYFEKHLMKKMYNYFIEDHSNLLNTQARYKRTFRRLRKSFEILSAETVDMSAIDWSNNQGNTK